MPDQSGRYRGAQTQRSLQHFSIGNDHADNTTLREAALASGKVTAEQFDSIVKPINMIGDGLAGA